jgi:hypothetical protein
MKAAVALIVAAIGFYAGVAWAGDAAPAAAERPATAAEAFAPKRQAPAATPVPKARSTTQKVPTLRMPQKTGREVICACGHIDRHA